MSVTDEFAKDEKLEELVALLKQLNDTYGSKVALTCSFGGVGGILLAHAVSTLSLPFTVVFNDTDFLFPETYALKTRLQKEWNLNVRTVKSELTPDEQRNRYGESLWLSNPDLCCTLRKVDPMAAALKHYDCWITGLRRDQGESRRFINVVERHTFPDGHTMEKVNPLTHWTEKDVWNYIYERNIPYNALVDKGYRSIGCVQCTAPTTDGDGRSGRWQGQSKTECGLHTFSTKGDDHLTTDALTDHTRHGRQSP